MNRTSRNYFILAIIVFIISFFYFPNGNAQKNSIYKSGGTGMIDRVIDTNKYKYFLKLPYDQNQFKRKIDTIYQISMLLGKSMSVDQSEQYKSLILSVLNGFSKDARIDSIKK